MTSVSSYGLEGESSLDELALSTRNLPRPLSARARSNTPLAYKSPNVRKQVLDFDAAPSLRGASPSKSMILETPAKPGSSPWRIKVTVEAEPNSDEQGPIATTPSKPSFARSSRKMIVPLKDPDYSSVKRGRGRPRKSETITPAASAIKKRKGTPMRRRSTRLSADNTTVQGGDDAAESLKSEKATPKKRGRPKRNPTQEDNSVPTREPAIVDAGTRPQSGAELDPDHSSTSTQQPSPIYMQTENDGNRSPTPIRNPTPQNRSLPFEDRAGEGKAGSLIDKSIATSSPIFSRESSKHPYEAEKPPEFRKQPTPSQSGQPNFGHPAQALSAVHNSLSSPIREELDVDGVEDEDAKMWRHMIPTQDDDASTHGGTSPAPDSEDSDHGGGMEFTGRPIGENTMMRSEEFSMLSLDSLRELQSSFVEGGQTQSAEETTRSYAKPLPKLNRPWLRDNTPNKATPSPLLQHSAETSNLSSVLFSTKPLLSQRPSQQAKSVLKSTPSRLVTSSNFSRAAQVSNNLQQAIDRPSKESPIPLSAEFQFPSFANQSFTAGRVSHNTNPVEHSSTAARGPSVRTGPLTTVLPSDTRLPTPNSSDKESQNHKRRPATSPFESIEHSGFYQSPANPILTSPAKSEGEMSWQTESPPFTSRGTPTTPETGYDAGCPHYERQGSSGATPTSNKVVEKEAQWQRAREEVSRTIQSAKADKIVLIESEEEDVEDEEEVEEEEEDVWQEERSRESNGEEPSQLDQSSYSQRSVDAQQRRTDSSWISRQENANSFSIDGTIDEEEERESNDLREDEEHSRKASNSAEISALFKSITGTKRPHNDDPEVSPFKKPRIPNELRAAVGEARAAHGTTSRPRAVSRHGHANDWNSAIFHSPSKSSHLKHQLGLGSCISSIANQSTLADTDVSMASDVRQLRHELQTSRNHAAPKASGFATRTIPTKTTSIDDTIEDEEEEKQQDISASSLLSIAPKRLYKPLFPSPSAKRPQQQYQQDHPPAAKRQKTCGTTESPPQRHGFFSRIVESIVSFGTPSPKHPLLAELPLLPRGNPWSKTHYQVLDKLYQMYKHSPEAFSPTHPLNAGLITPSISKYVDFEAFNWGYYIHLNANLIILSAILMKLLVLHDAPEYELLAGKSIEYVKVRDHGLVDGLADVPGEDFTEFHVVMRLFTIILGEKSRADIKKGKVVDESIGPVCWRFAGENQWTSFEPRLMGRT